MNEARTTKHINIAIPTKEHTALKIAAANTGRSMTAIVLEAIRDWLRKAAGDPQ